MISVAITDGSIIPYKRYHLGDDIKVRINRGNVNIQVNNYGSLSKEEIVARLSGKAPVPTIQAAPVELPNPNDIDVSKPVAAKLAG